MKNKKGKKNLNFYLNQPLLSNNVLFANYYTELQKNNWAKIVEDDTEELIKYVKITK